VGPVILGVILGPLMDVSYRRAVMSVKNDFGAFLLDLVSNPITLVMTLAVLLMLINQTPLWNLMKNAFTKHKGQPPV
jgi:putative tricarboxylic transport membrane protein